MGGVARSASVSTPVATPFLTSLPFAPRYVPLPYKHGGLLQDLEENSTFSPFSCAGEPARHPLVPLHRSWRVDRLAVLHRAVRSFRIHQPDARTTKQPAPLVYRAGKDPLNEFRGG